MQSLAQKGNTATQKKKKPIKIIQSIISNTLTASLKT